MKTTVLYSGGKDSCYALHYAYLQGYDVVVLTTIIPHYDYSMIYHKPFENVLKLQSISMGIPIEIEHVYDDSNELIVLKKLLMRVRDEYGVKTVFTGCVISDYQRMLFTSIADEIGLKIVNPFWRIDEKKYLFELIDHGFEFMLVSINTYGLPPYLLGRVITRNDIVEIISRSEKYGFNPSLDGGEAETIVVNAPLFSKRIVIEGRVFSKNMYEHYFIIEKAYLS
ncbi:MAG: diphthine--ammonia ligase [Desulfurococcaceae archaeon]|uniref:Diphthine--ammonia ligase n=1 Tax=Staphylothermus marinus TaxID=2280 RepID=A0A7C4HG13_STAMA